jgi:hypothetical protein
MKQLLSLFLFLFPCLAMAQYPGNGNQKITLGEQTTADGLVYRGLAADTTRKPSVDTMAYILLDTNTNIIWQYKKAVNNAWTRLGGSISSGVTGVLPVANGGTNTSTLTANKVMVGNGTSGVLTPTELNWDNTNKRLGIGTSSPNSQFHIYNNSSSSSRIWIENNGTGSGSYAEFVLETNSGRAGFIKNSSAQAGYSGAGSLNFGTISSENVGIITNNTSRLIVTGTGNVGIGTISPLSKLNIMGTVRINSADEPDANYYLQLENSASQKAKANSWDTYSDKRIKTDIQPILNAIDKVNLLNPVYYEKHDSYVENDFLNIDYDSSVKSLGFIAQEVYNIIPEAVNTGTTNELWAMDYTKIIPILTKAIQEQQTLIKALEQRILTLENK